MKINAKYFIALITGLFLIAIPFYNYLTEAVYYRFLTQLIPLSNYIFICITIGYLSILLRWLQFAKGNFKKYTIALLIIPFFLLLRFYNIDVAVYLNIIYFNVFFFFGSFVQNLYNKEKTVLSFAISILYGMIVFVLLSFLLSIFHFATGRILLIFIIFLSIISFFTENNIITYLKENYKKVNPQITQSYWGISLFITILLVLFFQTNNQPGYDELWYSLRTHELLNWNGSFFDEIIYPNNWVVYYPKLFEILIFPLQTFDNYAFSKIFSVFIWIIIFIIILDYLKEVSNLSIYSNKLFIIALAIVCTPAVSNIAIFTKGDILSLFIFLIAILLMIKSYKQFNLFYLFLSVILSILSITARLSAIPFAFILVVFAIYILLYFILKRKKLLKISIFQLAILSGIFLVIVLVFYRTYILTGVPIVQMEKFPFVNEIYNFLGFDYNNEYLQPLIKKEGNSNNINLFFSSVFSPNKIRASMAWYSNYFIFLLFLTAIYFKKTVILNFETIISLFLIIIFFTVRAMGFNSAGGDGNYFIIPVIISSVLLAGNNINKKILLHVSFFYLTVHFVLTLVTGPNWDPGFKEIKTDLTNNPFSGVLNKELIIERANKMYNLKELSEKIPDDERIYLAGSGDDIYNFLLGHSYLNMRYCRPHIFENFNYFNKFLKDAQINYLLVQTFPNNSKYYKYCEELEKNNNVITHYSTNYKLLDLRKYAFTKKNIDQREKRATIKVSNPQMLYSPKQETPHWIKPFKTEYLNYYEQPVALLAKGAACYYNFKIEGTKNLQMNLTCATYFNSKKFAGKGNVSIKLLSASNELLFEKKINVDHFNVIQEKLDFFDLKKGKYKIEIHFENGNWNNWVSLAISKPEIIILK